MTKKEIKTNELRIGNYMYNFSNWNTIRITAKDILDFESSSFNQRLVLFQPILLNDKILQKIGFEVNKPFIENKNTFREYMYRGFVVRKFGLDNYYCVNHNDVFKGNNISMATKAIQYVHQLQNLFFALKGEELILEL